MKTLSLLITALGLTEGVLGVELDYCERQGGLECRGEDECPGFLEMKLPLLHLRSRSDERKALLQKLRNLVCNERGPKVCCARETEEPCHYEGEEVKGETCNRDCTKDPTETKTCRFTFVLEQLLSNQTGRLADGMIRPVLVYNGQLVGPTIAVCEGDRVVVTLVNRLHLHGSAAQSGGFNSTTLHFHGIREKQPSHTYAWSSDGGPSSDGVPLVTQCPTPSGHTQTYCFSGINGAPAGTYWYHSHMGRQRMNGAAGKLIIMQRKKDHTRVDVDLPENSLFLQEWYPNTTNGIQQSLLINGKGKLGKHCYKSDDSENYDEFISNFKMGKQVSFTKYLCPPHNISTTYEVFNVKEPGQKYRFRIIGGIGDDVPIRVSIENHKFSVIATDARDVIKSADNFDALWVSAGERYDIVINTKKSFKKQAYKINVYHKNQHGAKILQLCTLAWLRYPSQTVPMNYTANCKAMAKEDLTRVLNPVPNKFSEWDNPNYIYPVNLTAVHQAPNIQEVLNTQYITIPVHEKKDKKKKDNGGFTFNNFTMRFPEDYPDIPFLFQSPSKNTKRCGVRCVWDSTGSPRSTKCSPFPAWDPQISKYPNKAFPCQHVIQQPWYDDSSDRQYWFEIILINNQPEGGIAHPIHHHGGWFHIVGMGQFNHPIYRDTIIEMDTNCTKKKECLPRNYKSPVFKDVIQVPTNGYVIFRAAIDNRGTWIVHCHINYHVEHGMTMIFQIGEPDGVDVIYHIDGPDGEKILLSAEDRIFLSGEPDGVDGWSTGPDKKTARKNKNKKCPKV
eukprot:GFUD01129321.1.p1 GENE.GFUD01129321.1~~GFUD01129321.1.p1  ORF type:complete len:786 (+),score=119.87 GFUD01129321.1:144-2501(+)